MTTTSQRTNLSNSLLSSTTLTTRSLHHVSSGNKSSTTTETSLLQKSSLTGMTSNSVSDKKAVIGLGSSRPLTSSTSASGPLTSSSASGPLNSSSGSSLSDYKSSSTRNAEELRQDLASKVKLSGVSSKVELSGKAFKSTPGFISLRSEPSLKLSSTYKSSLGPSHTVLGPSHTVLSSRHDMSTTKSNVSLTSLTAAQHKNTPSCSVSHRLTTNTGPVSLKTTKTSSLFLTGATSHRSSNLASHRPLTSLQGRPLSHVASKPLLTTSRINLSSTTSSHAVISKPQAKSLTMLSSRVLSSGPLTRSVSTSSSERGVEVTKQSRSAPDRKETKFISTTHIIKPIDENTEGAPRYNLSSKSHPKVAEKSLFISPDCDATLQVPVSSGVDIIGLKTTFLNAVATSLLSSPDFRNPRDQVLKTLSNLGERLSRHDPEFILKLAIYTRLNLNIRTTANFLLALAAKIPSCRHYLRKYYSATIRIPSDWIEVAEIYQAFHDNSIKSGAIPTALRKVMGTKFTEFDSYQLGKYNKDKQKKKKPKMDPEKKKKAEKEKEEEKQKKYAADFPRLFDNGTDSGSSDDENSSVVLSESETKKEIERLTFSLKQLVRKIHISEPVEYVMCLVGKKYPEDSESFRKSRLPGMWDQERAGKRMKLPTPETWETQISTKGNHARVWQDLIDHNKLPFMAMLRNIRNLVISGVSTKHHQWVIKKLNDERAVVNSKQFPFRFFSAYEVLEQLERIADGEEPAVRKPRKAAPKKPSKKKPPKEKPEIDKKLLQKYKTALDNAIKIATCYNVKPISGSTLIICNVGSNMDRPCTAARGLGKPRKVLEVGILLGLMCKYSCEESTMLIYGKKNSFTEVDLEDGTILHNMHRVMQTASSQDMTSTDGVIPFSCLTNMLLDRQQVDNIVLLTDAMNLDDQQGRSMMDFLQKYRHLVNPNLLFVSVDLSGSTSGISSTIQPEHSNDIYLAGYSDQILRFIAERGDSGQLTYVEHIDRAFNLTEIKLPSLSKSALVEEEDNHNPLTLSSEKTMLSTLQGHKWRTLRVFISSTFKDMHGERDLLTRFVFPELRARAHSRQIHIYEVDLRWGVTEKDARSNKALEICLEEISKSQYFIGLLSQRYGWIQEEYKVSDIPEFDWLKDFPPRKSITEVEMHHAALSNTDEAVGKAFFYFRDPSFLNQVPQQYREDFDCESDEAMEKMEDLKSAIRMSGLEVYDNYPSKWLGKVDDKLLVGGLKSFGKRVLENLWNAIQRDYRDDEITGDAISQATAQHTAFEEERASSFIGRRKLLEKAMESLEASDNKLVLLAGKPGSGKSAFMAALAQEYTASHSNVSNKLVLSHFIGAAPGSSNIASLLNRLCLEMKRRFAVIRDVPEDYTDLVKEWPVFLEESVANLEKVTPKVMIMIDGIDLLEEKYNGRSMDWIPDKIPDGVVLVLSGVEGGAAVSNLRGRKSPPSEVVIGPLDMYDKAEMVRKKLKKYRKTLDESPFNNQMKILLTKKEATNPLFLHLACEELRVFGIYEEVSDYLKTMPTTISNLLQNVLMRLEVEHTTEILSMSLIFLTLVRNGLLEYELSGVLKLAMKELYPEIGGILPPMVMSKLLRSLQTFLQPTGQETQDMLNLAHKDIEKAVKLRYMRGTNSNRETHLHMLLARFYREQVDPLGNGTFKGNSVRGFVELPYHLMEAGAWSELEEVMCNFRYVIAKCELGLAQQLLEDYTPTVVGLPKGKVRELVKFIQLPSVLNFKSFVSRNLHILLVNPSLALQQAFNEPTSSLIARSSKDILQAEKGSTNPMIIWVNKPETSNPCQMTISSQSSPVLCVDVSLDSSLFVAGFKNGAVKVYEVATGKEAHTFIGHASGVADVCFVGSFNYVCSASHDTTLSLWDTKSGIRVATLKGHSRGVHGCAANKTGKNVVSVSWDTTIKVWEGRTGKLINTLKTQGQHNTPINCVSFHPEGQLVAVGSWDKTLKIWDTFNQKRLKVLKGHKSSVQVCAYAPSGRHVVSAALDGEVKIWSTRSGSSVGTIVGHHSPVNAITFTPNGQFLVTGSSDKVLKVWSGSLGQLIRSISSPSSESGFVHKLVFDHINQLVGVGYHDGHVKQFNIQTGAEVFAVKPHSAAVVGLANHSNLHMSASADGTIKVWDHASLPKTILLKGHDSPLTCAVWDKNGFASASEDFSILVWPSKTNTYTRILTEKYSASKKKKRKSTKQTAQSEKELAVAQSEKELAVKPLVTLHGKQTGKITSLAFSCDSVKLVAVSHDQSITVWNCLSYQIVQTLHSCHMDWITTCCFSDISADVLITGSSDFTLKVWDMSSGKEKATFKGHTSAINSVAFSQGCIVSAAFDGSVKVWTQKGVEITTMFCHQQRTNTCLLHIPSRAQANQIISSWADVEEDTNPNSRMKLEDIMVLTGSDDGTVGVWKPFLPNEIASLIGHSDRVLSAATTLNNQILTSSLDGSIRLWNPPLPINPVEDLTLVNISQGHTGPITSLSTIDTPEGSHSYIASGGRDGCVIVWKVRTKKQEGDGGDGDTITKLYHVKDSEKAVSSVYLTTIFQDISGATNLVAGSDSGTLNIYSFSKLASPIVVSTLGDDTLMGPHPLSKLIGAQNSIVASSWSNRVVAIGKNKSVYDRMDNHKDWVTDLVMADNLIYSIGLDNNMYSWRLPSDVSSKGQGYSSSNAAIKYSLHLKPHDDRTSVWPLSLCDVQGTKYLAISDSEGQITLWSRANKKIDVTKKLHNKQINVVTSVCDECFMTGSDDSTVKVWRIQGEGRNVAIVQIGQFYCQSCITAITKVENYLKNARPEFVVGDSLGHVMLLRWDQ